MADTPDNVLGIRAKGVVTADDYRDILIPAIEERAEKFSKLRLLYVLGEDFLDFTGAAAWEDTKVGLSHFLHFDRIAVVTDTDWIRRSVRVIGFTMPAEVRVFGTGALSDARSWISEPTVPGSLAFELDRDDGVLRLEPHGELKAEDFERLAQEVDPYIEAHGRLAGIVIDAAEFPGWDDFLAFAAHMRFIREHMDHVRRIALITDSRFLSVIPRLATLFADAETRRFDPLDRDAALSWVSGN